MRKRITLFIFITIMLTVLALKRFAMAQPCKLNSIENHLPDYADVEGTSRVLNQKFIKNKKKQL